MLVGTQYSTEKLSSKIPTGEMKWHHALWRKLTDTEALRESSGRYETEFFESTYRVTYFGGFSQSDHSVWYKLYSHCIMLLIALLVCGEFWYLCTMGPTLEEALTNTSFVISNIIAFYWYQMRLKYKHVFKKLAMSMESPYFDASTQARSNIVQFWARRSDRYVKLLLGLGVGTSIAWYLTSLFGGMEKKLIINCRVPYNYETPLRYAFTNFVLAVAIQCIAFFVIVHDLIMQSHLMHLLCQFQILADCFENIIDDCSLEFAGCTMHNEQALFYRESFQRKYEDQLRKHVKQHQILLDQTLQFRSLMSTPMLLQFGTRAMLICFQGYQLITAVTGDFTKLMMSVFYLGYNMFVLFVYCRWCEEITTKSMSIRDAVYMSGWERGLVAAMPRVRLQLLFVAARAARPLVFTAGGLYDLSLSSYTSLIKTSYSAITVLLQVRR